MSLRTCDLRWALRDEEELKRSRWDGGSKKQHEQMCEAVGIQGTVGALSEDPETSR